MCNKKLLSSVAGIKICDNYYEVRYNTRKPESVTIYFKKYCKKTPITNSKVSQYTLKNTVRKHQLQIPFIRFMIL